MNNYEDEHSKNDFEIEFTDLPPGETESIVASLLIKSAHHLARTPASLLAILSRKDMADPDQEEEENDEFEITYLPLDENGSFSSRFVAFASHLSTRALIWRAFILACTLLLILLLILHAYPSMFDSSPSPFAQPTPTPANAVSISWSSIRVITEQTPGAIIVGQKPTTSWTKSTTGITIWDTNALPGPPPDGRDCLGRPKIDFSHQVGNAPAWATGFTAPYATLHLYPTPVSVPAFSNSFGWTASILLSIQTNYANPITLNGSDIHSGSSILFQIDSRQDPSAFLTLDPSQTTTNLTKINSDSEVSWSVTLYFPTAGCYFLMASWPGGSWNIHFAAGQ